MKNPRNLFREIPAVLPEELVEVLAEGCGRLRVVRLVSRGHASPDGFWYDQPEHEWVALLRGSARLSFEDAASGAVSEVAMEPGDWISIPPRTRHRVEATDPSEDTVWIALHWSEEE